MGASLTQITTFWYMRPALTLQGKLRQASNVYDVCDGGGAKLMTSGYLISLAIQGLRAAGFWQFNSFLLFRAKAC